MAQQFACTGSSQMDGRRMWRNRLVYCEDNNGCEFVVARRKIEFIPTSAYSGGQFSCIQDSSPPSDPFILPITPVRQAPPHPQKLWRNRCECSEPSLQFFLGFWSDCPSSTQSTSAFTQTNAICVSLISHRNIKSEVY